MRRGSALNVRQKNERQSVHCLSTSCIGCIVRSRDAMRRGVFAQLLRWGPAAIHCWLVPYRADRGDSNYHHVYSGYTDRADKSPISSVRLFCAISRVLRRTLEELRVSGSWRADFLARDRTWRGRWRVSRPHAELAPSEMAENKSAEQVAAANGHGCHASCCRRRSRQPWPWLSIKRSASCNAQWL
jgi:hypothetical protein